MFKRLCDENIRASFSKLKVVFYVKFVKKESSQNAAFLVLISERACDILSFIVNRTLKFDL